MIYWGRFLCFFLLMAFSEEAINKDKVVLTYNMECAGNKTFLEGASEAVCEALPDEDMNHSCDLDFRKTLFEELCPGQNFPHKVSSPRNLVVSSFYEYKESHCNTGRHYFYFSNAVSFQREYCKHLKNDVINNYCASSSRQKAYQQNCQ